MEMMYAKYDMLNKQMHKVTFPDHQAVNMHNKSTTAVTRSQEIILTKHVCITPNIKLPLLQIRTGLDELRFLT